MRVSSALKLIPLSLCLIGLVGCFAHVPHNVLPSPPSEEVRRQLGRVALEVSGVTPSDVSSDSVVERLQQKSGGASGSFLIDHCGPNKLCMGALEATLRDDIVRTARDSAGQPIQMFDSTAQGDADTLLKIENIEFVLLGGIHPNLSKGLTFYMTACVRLIQQATNRELYAGQIEYLGRTLPLADWDNYAPQSILDEFELASHELAEKVVDTVFLLYRFTGLDLH
jgi:hypothetical protein